MNPPETSDPIDALLREENHYVEDGGFTQRVARALPARRRAWFRPLVLLSAIAIGSGLAVCWLPWGNLPALNLAALRSLDAQPAQLLLPWVVVTAVIASLVWGLAAALQWED